MHALPALIALLIAAVIAPSVLRSMRAAGSTRPNYRGRDLAFPLGVLVLAAAVLAMIPLTLLARLGSSGVFHPEVVAVSLYAAGVIALGLIDDTLGSQSPAQRGWRGHGASLLRGEPS